MLVLAFFFFYLIFGFVMVAMAKGAESKIGCFACLIIPLGFVISIMIAVESRRTHQLNIQHRELIAKVEGNRQ